ncbi:hypothetical protein [uncultured Brachyspira sp.]|uniref:hypothetical protein n=1 Tax=uncultured Brachyspira sp. TaxID=221953 RepID=UPI002609FB51|nr:hypothetical protein [uncultured Brachyspira sp.]
MKLEKLKNKLESQVKELILKILKDFDMSKYKDSINVNEKYTGIDFIDTNKDLRINIFFPYYGNNALYDNYELIIRLYQEKELLDYQLSGVCVDEDRGYYEHIKFYSAEDIISFLDSEPIQIIKILNDNKELLEKELKNILE